MKQYIDIFVEETKEHLSNMNQNLLKLEKSSDDKVFLDEIFRSAHTLKGMAGTMGFNKISEVTHMMENILQRLRIKELKIDTNIIDLLFNSFDILESLVDNIIKNSAEGDIQIENIKTELDKYCNINNIQSDNDSKRDHYLKSKQNLESSKKEKKIDTKNKDRTKKNNNLDYEKSIFNEFEQNLIEAALKENLNIYKVSITLSEECMLKSARAFIIFKKMEEIGEIIKTIPPVEDIEDENFSNHFKMFIITKVNINEMEKSVEIKADNLEKALEKAANELNCSIKQIDYKIIDERKSSFAGIKKGYTVIKAKTKINERTSEEKVLDNASKIIDNIDGYFKINFNEEGVYLQLFPPEGSGNNVSLENVKKYLITKKIKDVNYKEIKKALEQNVQIEVLIAPPQEEFIEDSKIEVTVSKDKMKAYLLITSPIGGKWVNEDDVKLSLNEHGITYGIKEEIIKKTVETKHSNESILIAEGESPIKGKDAKLEYHFETSKDKVPKLLEDGKVDFRDLNLVENINKDDLLATKTPPEKGTPGYNVFGDEIPPQGGKDLKIPLGKNVYCSEDGISCYASTDGQVLLISGKINVYPIFEINGDVSTSTGNISFNGTVVVKGNVRSGFEIIADGDIEINGSVESAIIKAGGSVIIKRGVQGKGKGYIEAIDDIIVKYIENSKLQAKGNILAGEAIMHSVIEAGSKIEVNGKKGLIVGGIARATEEISAKTIGSPMATKTILDVGLDPLVKQNYMKAKKKKAEMENDLKKTDQALVLLSKMEKSGSITNDKIIMLKKLKKTKNLFTDQLEEINKEIESYEENNKNTDKGKIKVSNKIFPGVYVTIGNASMRVRDDLNKVLLFKSEGEIRVGSHI